MEAVYGDARVDRTSVIISAALALFGAAAAGVVVIAPDLFPESRWEIFAICVALALICAGVVAFGLFRTKSKPQAMTVGGIGGNIKIGNIVNSDIGKIGHDVHFGPKDRRLDEASLKQFLALPKNARGEICAVIGVADAEDVADQIAAFLVKKGYPAPSIMTSCVMTETIRGIEVSAGAHEWQIVVGFP